MRNNTLTAVVWLVTGLAGLGMPLAHGFQDPEPPGEAEAKQVLTIGDPAPPIQIEHWISDNYGLLPHIRKFEEGHVYVIDFWSTEWTPSIRQMPHLAKLQAEYDQQDVQIISIGNESLSDIEAFLATDLPKSQQSETRKTYADLTATYCLATDDDGSVFKDYFLAADQSQIPCCFVVGKTGLIEWIGPPMNLDEPLKKIVGGQWDRQQFKLEFEKLQASRSDEDQIKETMERAMQGFPNAARQGPEEALDYLNRVVGDPEFSKAEFLLRLMRVQILIGMQHEQAVPAMQELTHSFATEDHAGELNDLAWAIYERQVANADVSREILEEAREMALVAAKLTPTSGAVNDTVAHLLYLVDGDLDKAIEWQKKAVANAEGREDDLQPFLDQLLEEKKTGNKAAPKKEKKTDF